MSRDEAAQSRRHRHYEKYGVDPLEDHRDVFPPEYPRWVEIGGMKTLNDLGRDQSRRSQVHDAFRGVFVTYDLLATPILAVMPVKNRDGGNTLGPAASAAFRQLRSWNNGCDICRRWAL